MDLLLEGRYRIGELIGTGGAASVYRAFDEFLGRDVAVKVFDATTPDDEDYRRRHTETLLLATLNHSGLVTLFAAGLHQDSFGATSSYLVMELIDGQDSAMHWQHRLVIAETGVVFVTKATCTAQQAQQFVRVARSACARNQPANVKP